MATAWEVLVNSTAGVALVAANTVAGLLTVQCGTQLLDPHADVCTSPVSIKTTHAAC